MISAMARPGHISPAALRAYLVSHAWELQSRPLPRIEIWGRGEYEVLVPLNPEASDYPRRIHNFIEDVANEAGLGEEEIARQLLYLEDDVINLRFKDDRPFVPLSQATKILNKAKEFAVVNACSVIRRKSYHGRSRPKVAKEHAEIVGMGHTGEGSFIIPIVSPVGVIRRVVIESQQEPIIDVESERNYFPRRVTGMMADVLRLLHEFAVQRDTIPSKNELRRAVYEGLSADACFALAEMISTPNIGDLDISFKWALTSAPPRIGGEVLEFPKASAGIIKEIGHLLQQDVKVSDRVLYGFVSSLDRDPDDDEGVVKVKALIDGRVRPVKMTLGPDAYHTAIEANDLKLRVVVAGSLFRSTTGRYTMPRVDLFRIDGYLPLEVNSQTEDSRSNE